MKHLFVLLFFLSFFSFQTLAQAPELKCQTCFIKKNHITLGDILVIDPQYQDIVLSSSPKWGLKAIIPPQVIHNLLKPLGLYLPELPSIHVIRQGQPLLLKDLETYLEPHLKEADSSKKSSIVPTSYEWVLKTSPLYKPVTQGLPFVDHFSLNDRLRSFKASLVFQDQEGDHKLDIEGYVYPLVSLPVLTCNLKKGTLIQDEHFVFEERRLIPLRASVLLNPENVKGLMTSRALRQGDILYERDIEKPLLVKKNAFLTVKFEEEGLMIKLQGQAQQNGYLGDFIRVKNPQSQKLFTCRVTDVDQAVIEREEE